MITRIALLKSTLIATFMLGLISCGWQLRGYEPNTPYKETKLTELKISSSTRNNAFFRRLSSALKRNSIREDSGSDYTLEIFQENIDRKPLAYNSIGTPSQYKLTVSVEYRFSLKGEVLLPISKVTSRRNYDFDPNLIIAKDKEQEALVKEIRDEISQRIIDSINSVL